LRWYPRGAWRGWIPIPTPLYPEFDDPAEVDAIIDRVRHGVGLGSSELILPASGDSWQAFCGSHGDYGFYEHWKPTGWFQLERRERRATPKPASTRAQREQEKWEAEALERRRAKQAEQDRLWREEEQRRQAQRLPPPGVETIADRALQAFMSIRQQCESGKRFNVGEMCSTVTFSVIGPIADDTIIEAMRRLSAQIPDDAPLSTRPLAGSSPACASASNGSVAIQALLMSHNAYTGQANYRFAATWDYP
jgi:hypothetical protein